MSSQSVFAAAADALAGSVLGALSGAGDTVQLARFVDDAPDTLAALAAVRLIGADAFSPYLLAGNPFQAQDAAVVTKAFEAFPAQGGASPSPSAPNETIVAWRDWATVQLLTRFGGDGPPGTAAGVPQGHGELSDTADWRTWSVRMAQLAPLATLGLEGPVHEAARGGALPLSQGVSRSILRRDFTTAVRLIRWLAWLHHEGTELPLDPALAAEHVWLVGGAGPRTALDLAIVRHFLERRPRTVPKAAHT
ncbi:hypothetical protein [Streptomyces sp. NPDC060035]|uniref:hypothetical protein n=1 Tax=Streptomyces sp. NPDC060035 TaxID=3347044 RepID=UPI0036A2D8AE